MRACALLLALLLLPWPAHAQSHDRRSAAVLFQKGRSLYDQALYDEALVAFRSGYELFPLRGFLVNIGQCYRKLDRIDEAADTWRQFLATHPSDPRLRGEVEEALSEVVALHNRRADAEAARRGREIDTTAPSDDDAARASREAETALRNRELEDSRREAVESVAATAAPSVEPAALTTDVAVHARAPHKKSRWWVWTLVGVAIAGAAAGGVAVGLIEYQQTQPHPGSLGLIDGRR